MKLGDMIREYRTEHRYSLREFADLFWKALIDFIVVDRNHLISVAFLSAKVLAERMAKYDAGALAQE